jgi:hypothetical protein
MVRPPFSCIVGEGFLLLLEKAEGRRQKVEGGGQRAGGRGQEAEGRRQRAGGKGLLPCFGGSIGSSLLGYSYSVEVLWGCILLQ